MLNPIKKILIIEDDRENGRPLYEMLIDQRDFKADLTHVQCMNDAEKYLAKATADIILLDLVIPEATELEAIRRAHAAAPYVPLVVITGLKDDVATKTLHAGAQDYLIRGQFESHALSRAMRKAVERKNIEETRQQLERLKDEFVASVSHELRTPLTSIHASLSLMMGKAAEKTNPELMARLLKIAHNNSQRLLQLVNDILDVEKLESGQVLFNFRRVEIRSLLKEVLDANKGFADQHNVRMQLESIDGAVDDVRADPDRLFQVMTNLLSNAIKFSPRNGIVTVAVKMTPDDVEISVRDHGPGIAAEFKPRVFDRFAQADTTDARRKNGTGLGLSIVKQIVDRLRGEVWFSDARGGGTIFHLRMPSWTRTAQQAVDRSAVPDAVRILLCDGDMDAAILLREQLMPFGICTDFSYTAFEAVTCARVAQYHAIVVDLNLPDGNGINLIMQLRELPQYQHTPIIVLSSDPSVGRRDLRSLDLNVSDWLYKPVDIGRLVKLFVGPVVSNADKRPPILHIEHDAIQISAAH